MTAADSILVTGGAGFVGSHFARAALEAGSHVVILDDLSAGAYPTLPAAIAIVRGDIGDRALVLRLLGEHRITAVAHFAGKIQVGESIAKPDYYREHNVTRALALLETVREHVRAFLFSSSAAVYGTPQETPIVETADLAPINPYGETKLEFERALHATGASHGLAWAALRYFNAAGAHPDGTLRENHEPETHLIPLVIDAGLGRRGALTIFGDDYPTPDGTCIRDYVHVSDLADAHLAALKVLDRGTAGAINLGSASGFSVREVIAAASSVIGRAIPVEIGPRRTGDPPVLVASNARAAEILGWRPRRSQIDTILEDALRSRR